MKIIHTNSNFRYFECNIKGEEEELLCDDGLVFDEKSQNCDYPSKVVCGPRTKLRKFLDNFSIRPFSVSKL